MSTKEETKKSTDSTNDNKIVSLIKGMQNVEEFKELTWEGSFSDYLSLVQKNPKITRTAFQRLYDMLLSYGTEEYQEYKEKLVKYKFFDDPIDNGRDAIYGLERALMKFVNLFNSAARGYGTEKTGLSPSWSCRQRQEYNRPFVEKRH